MVVDDIIQGECSGWTEAEYKNSEELESKYSKVPKCEWGDGIQSTGKGILSAKIEGEVKMAVEVEKLVIGNGWGSPMVNPWNFSFG